MLSLREPTFKKKKGSFEIKVLTLVQNITKNIIRHARGAVEFYIKSITYIECFLLSKNRILNLRVL